MSEEKQIQEMANTYYTAMLKASRALGSMNEGAPKWYAKEFYNAGWRQQSEGKWIFNPDGSGTCDQCGFTQKNVWDYDNYQNYCGHCGAKMEGGK